MKIVQVSPWFLPHLGGVESHVHSISSELVRRGHEVEVLTSRQGRDVPEKEVMDGFQITRLKPFATLLRTPIVTRTKGALRERDVDIFHAHSPPPLSAYYASKVAAEKRLPFVLTYHCDIEIPSVFGLVIEEVYRRTLGTRTMRRANRIIVTTETYAATSRAIWKYSPVVIPNPVDFEFFRPDIDGSEVRSSMGLKKGQHIVLWVGRVVPHKGIENLVEAAQYVDGTKFIIGGEGPQLPAIRRLAKSFDVEDRVIFSGRLARSELPKYYAACDVFVLPSVSRLEAFGIVALEAMSSGRPVVVTDMPGVREVVRDGIEGLLCEPLNAEDLAEKINTLLGDPGKRSEMGRAGRKKVVEDFGIKKVVDKLEATYKEVLPAWSSLSPDGGKA